MKSLFTEIVTKSHPKCFGLGICNIYEANNFYNAAIPRADQVMPKEPIVFQKSLDSISFNSSKIYINSSGTNHEIELGVFIGKKGINISTSEAINHIGGYFLCLDLTSSFIVRKDGKSFCIAKSRDDYLPISEFIEKSMIDDPNDVDLLLEINGEVSAKGNTSEMVFNVEQQIEYISKFTTLNPGDMILTGTPLPMKQIFKGDKMHMELNYKGKLLANMDLEVDYE